MQTFAPINSDVESNDAADTTSQQLVQLINDKPVAASDLHQAVLFTLDAVGKHHRGL